MTRLAGRTALVTGAGSGIGWATATAFAREGARVVCLDVNEEAAVATATHIGADNAFPVGCDVTDAAGIERAFARLDGNDWLVDVLFSGAGVDRLPGDGFDEAMQGHAPQITLMSADAWRRMLSIHLDGAFLLTQHVVRRLVAGGREGSLMFVSSIAGTAGWGTAHYATAKAGLLGLTRALARELGPRRIRVNAICPGVIDTPMVANIDPGLVGALKMMTPLGRLGTPDEVAALAVHLASDESGFITGQAISPNGGLVIS